MCILASGPTDLGGEPSAYTVTSPLQYPLGFLSFNSYFFKIFSYYILR